MTPTLADSGTATMTVNGSFVTSGTAFPVTLSIGSNPAINIVVTAQDGTKKIYTIIVTRAPSSNADLSNVILSSARSP